jgi:flagellin
MEVFIMVVQHNLSAMNSNRMLGITQGTLSSSTEKLSSGYKINRAADDAAGLAISEKMRKQIRGLTQASSNAEDGISSVQTAEGALTEVHDMLQRMNELAVKAANGTNSEDDRSYIQDEIDQLTQEIDRVAETTKFNETYLLKGDASNEKGMGVTYSYGAVATATAARASFQKTGTATGITVTVSFVKADSDHTGITAAESNDLAKALKNQGITITTTTINGKIAYSLSLNGSDAKSNFNVITVTSSIKASTMNGGQGVTTYTVAAFKITNASNQTIATITIRDIGAGGIEDAKGNVTKRATLTAGRTQVLTAYSISAAYGEGDVYSLYDADGNAISANKLDKYFSAVSMDSKAGATAWSERQVNGHNVTSSISANASAPKVYDALGKEINAASVVKKQANNSHLINAVKDQTATLKLSFQVGADGTSNNKININIDAMNSKGLGINGLKVDGTNGTNATDAIEVISAAIKKVSTQRSALGAVQNRLEHTINNLDNIVENTTSAESQIRDTDMATEMVKYSNANILSQAGQSMLAQANQSNQGVLSLLG